MTNNIARIAIALFVSFGLADFGTAVASADPFSQQDFPCAEDEVLGYAPQFGPDRVGCIHIDDIRTEAR